MTQKAFYDWQTVGGGGDIMRLVEAHPELAGRLPEAVAKRMGTLG